MQIAERVARVAPSLTLAMSARAKQLAAEGRPIINLSAGEPDFDTPEHIVQAAIQAIHEHFTRYTPAAGIPALREAAASHCGQLTGHEYSAGNVVIASGAKHAIYNALQVVCQPGDEVLIPAPYWVSYPAQALLASAVPVEVGTSEHRDFKVTAEELRAALTPRSRVVIINSPGNPVGNVYSREELAAIAEVAIERDLVVISDEIYHAIVFPPAEHVSIVAVHPAVADRTVVINGVSKSYAMTGWRIGYLAAATPIADAAARLQSHSTSNATSISQRAALAAFRGPQECVAEMRAAFARRRRLVVDGLRQMRPLSVVEPQGAFYVFCNVSKTGLAPAVWAERLLEEAHVAVVPGEGFGSTTHVRLSFAAGDAQLREALERIGRWVQAL